MVRLSVVLSGPLGIALSRLQSGLLDLANGATEFIKSRLSCHTGGEKTI